MSVDTYREDQTETWAAAPLAETIERARARIPYLGVRQGPLEDGWLRASDVVDDADIVEALLNEVCGWYRTDNRQVAASFLVMTYGWHLMSGALACYLLERRMPDLSADAVGVHAREGVAFLSPRCFALTDDPLAGHPDVTVVPDLHALRSRFVQQVMEQHGQPLFATLRGIAPYGVRAMQANYVDRLATAILWLAEQLGDDDLARREVPPFIALADPRARTGYVEVEHEGRRGVFLHRSGCCLNFRLPGAEKCDTCSLRPAEERMALLRQHLAQGAG